MLVSDDRFLKKEVVVMEDSPMTQQAIKEVIEDELNWRVEIVNNKDEAIIKAETNKAAYYILDAHMGINREHEGLDALEVIKKVDSNAFVSIFSAYPDNERRAKNLEADIFVGKTANIREDVRQKLAPVMLERMLACLKLQEEDTRDQLDKLFNNLDPNINAYERLELTPEKFEQYEGKYVAFVDGELIAVADDDEAGDKLFEHLMNSPEYLNKPKFFTKAKKEILIIDEPSSLWFDGFEF